MKLSDQTKSWEEINTSLFNWPKARLLPKLPGVYWFLNHQDEVLYVGKAVNLANRLTSYTKTNLLFPKTSLLIKQTKKIRYKVLEGEIAALLTEARLIKLYQPKYNVLLKDDKSPLYLIITSEKFPKILALRKNDILDKFPKAKCFGPFESGYQVKKIINYLRSIFKFCNASDRDIKHKKACFYYHLNLCPGVCVGKIDYLAYQKIVSQIRLFMEGKHQILIKKLTLDILRLTKTNEFEAANNIKAIILAIRNINQMRLNSNNEVIPNLIEDIIKQDLMAFKRLLNNLGFRVAKLDRIEGYDASSFNGSAATAAMVVAINGVMTHQAYRHFLINIINHRNDSFMIGEAIRRRVKHLEWDIPDIIIVDGGKIQVISVINNLPWNILVVGIEKNPDRLIARNLKNRWIEYKLDMSDQSSRLIIKLRDEAHRFCRRLHHKVMMKEVYK